MRATVLPHTSCNVSQWTSSARGAFPSRLLNAIAEAISSDHRAGLRTKSGKSSPAFCHQLASRRVIRTCAFLAACNFFWVQCLDPEHHANPAGTATPPIYANRCMAECDRVSAPDMGYHHAPRSNNLSDNKCPAPKLREWEVSHRPYTFKPSNVGGVGRPPNALGRRIAEANGNPLAHAVRGQFLRERI